MNPHLYATAHSPRIGLAKTRTSASSEETQQQQSQYVVGWTLGFKSKSEMKIVEKRCGGCGKKEERNRK